MTQHNIILVSMFAFISYHYLLQFHTMVHFNQNVISKANYIIIGSKKYFISGYHNVKSESYLTGFTARPPIGIETE